MDSQTVYTTLFFLFGLVVWYAAATCRRKARHDRMRVEACLWILKRLLISTGNQEPTRKDLDDPSRKRYVFCGRISYLGHGHSCPWVDAEAMAASTRGDDDVTHTTL
jgi:hypothetical protein